MSCGVTALPVLSFSFSRSSRHSLSWLVGGPPISDSHVFFFRYLDTIDPQHTSLFFAVVATCQVLSEETADAIMENEMEIKLKFVKKDAQKAVAMR